MRSPTDLLHDAQYAFAFRTVEAAVDAPRTLLVLLHGVGGDELQWADFAGRVSAEMVVALPRGHRTISGERLGWFREGLSEDGPQIVADEADEARGKLIDFLEQLQRRHDVPPERTVVAGFSQGGMLAAAAGLTAPASLAGFAMLGGRVMPELEPVTARPPALAHLHALVLHGRRDDVLPFEWAERAAARLDALGIAHAMQPFDAAHEPAPAMQDALLGWLVDPSKPWNA